MVINHIEVGCDQCADTATKGNADPFSGRIFMGIDFIEIKQRSDRYAYLAKKFTQFLAGKILDVGCDEAVLKHLLPDLIYTGVDVRGEPDMHLDLEKIDRFPFEDEAFECVVCLDALEHLDNLHHVFSELVRVTKTNLIISLPNNWVNARKPLAKGRGSFGHYGLPVEAPGDRHKWFFSLSEAANFARGQERKYPISIIEIRVTEKPRPLLVRLARKLFYPSRESYLNRYASTLWIVFGKKRYR